MGQTKALTRNAIVPFSPTGTCCPHGVNHPVTCPGCPRALKGHRSRELQGCVSSCLPCPGASSRGLSDQEQVQQQQKTPCSCKRQSPGLSGFSSRLPWKDLEGSCPKVQKGLSHNPLGHVPHSRPCPEQQRLGAPQAHTGRVKPSRIWIW